MFYFLNRVPLTNIHERPEESADQNSAERMCSLILIYTHRKMNLSSRTTRQMLNGTIRFDWLS